MLEPLFRLLVAVGSTFVCVIPARYRQWWPIQNETELRGPAIASGMLEALIGAPGMALYFAFALNAARSGLGISGLILNPYLFLVFVFFEGVFRLLAALSSAQIMAILPLQIIAWIHNSLDKKSAQSELGILVTDEVEKAEGKPYDLRVLSCRPKAHWNPYMTVHFDGEFYQLMREGAATGARKFAYFLRRNPSTRLVVVVFEYRPDDVMNPSAPPRRWKP
ncbi:MAG TPA: hypothetical protein VFO86_10550 [Terriglobia bacterium]|nr:hypothetical protein [Terriglobia bacterium]